MVNEHYLKNETKNLARFISVMKFRPMPWRQSHPYILCDRFEDLTEPEVSSGLDIVAKEGRVSRPSWSPRLVFPVWSRPGPSWTRLPTALGRATCPLSAGYHIFWTWLSDQVQVAPSRYAFRPGLSLVIRLGYDPSRTWLTSIVVLAVRHSTDTGVHPGGGWAMA